MKDCSFCYEKERFPQIKKENEQLKSELETYQILAHKRGECYLSSLREIKKQKEENEQLKQKLNWFLTETIAGKEYRPKEELEELQRENEQLKAQIEKMKCCFNCEKPIKHLDCGDCHNGSNWELAQSDKLIRS